MPSPPDKKSFPLPPDKISLPELPNNVSLPFEPTIFKWSFNTSSQVSFVPFANTNSSITLSLFIPDLTDFASLKTFLKVILLLPLIDLTVMLAPCREKIISFALILFINNSLSRPEVSSTVVCPDKPNK